MLNGEALLLPVISPSLHIDPIEKINQIIGLFHLKPRCLEVANNRRQPREHVKHGPRSISLGAKIVALLHSRHHSRGCDVNG